ncbi:MAG: hypothetical protein HEQ39_06725 [Rhizobacter sp.]
MDKHVSRPAALFSHELTNGKTDHLFAIEGTPELWISQLAHSLGINKLDVQRFAGLMQAKQWPVDIGRLFMDSRYAFGRFALAHTSTDELPRHLALVLFEAYQRLENRRRSLCVGIQVLH